MKPSLPQFGLLLGSLVLFWLVLSPTGYPYPKAVKAEGRPSEIEDLFYLSLAKKSGLQWDVVPTDVFLKKIVLVPEEEYLTPIYTIDLRYPLKSVLYQSFLEMNLRYLLADQVKALWDYQEQLAKLKAFQKRAKKLLGPYWQELTAEARDASPQKGGENFLPVVNLGSLFSALQTKPTAGLALPSFGGGGKKLPGVERFRQPKPKNLQEADEEGGGEAPGFFQGVLKAVFGLIDWLGKNKEILLALYLLVVLFAFLFSSAKR